MVMLKSPAPDPNTNHIAPPTTLVVAIEALHKTDEVAVLGDDGTLLILSFTLAGCQVPLSNLAMV